MQCSSFYITQHKKTWSLEQENKKQLKKADWTSVQGEYGGDQRDRMRNENLPIKERYYTWLDPEGIEDWIG